MKHPSCSASCLYFFQSSCHLLALLVFLAAGGRLPMAEHVWSFTKESLGKTTCTSSINGVRCSLLLSLIFPQHMSSDPKLMTSTSGPACTHLILHTVLAHKNWIKVQSSSNFRKKAGHLGWLPGHLAKKAAKAPFFKHKKFFLSFARMRIEITSFDHTPSPHEIGWIFFL